MNLLLHICCGPCSLYVIDDLIANVTKPDGLYVNPNIHPYDEFIRRKESTAQACNIKNINLKVLDDYNQEKWENFLQSLNIRCKMCYDMRMELTAAYAAANGYTHFTTTLLVSPYQDHQLLSEICEKKAEKYGVGFLYRDFRPGFRMGQKQAKELGLYRQKYCGCIRSRSYE